MWGTKLRDVLVQSSKRRLHQRPRLTSRESLQRHQSLPLSARQETSLRAVVPEWGTGSSVFIVSTWCCNIYVNEQSLEFLQIFNYRESKRKSNTKYYSICPPSASITSWWRLEKPVHMSQITFWETLAHSFCSLIFRADKLWRWVVKTLLSGYDQVPRSWGMKSGKDNGYSFFGVKCGSFFESHF